MTFRDLVTDEDGSLGAAIQASDPQLTPEEASQAASDAEEEAEQLIEETL